MADDFRTLLKEAYRSPDGWGRTYEELKVGGVFTLSVQASDTHSSTPEEILDDPFQYEAFEVTLSQDDAPFIDTPGKGAWDELKQRPWAEKFGRGYIAGVRVAEYLPVAEVQRVFDDLEAYAENKGK
ncbi:hypothetical protein SAMN02745704_02846 [Paucidesulfovibrio gracilis DSM 16080]|uniref:Uncharacterized protein n=1 Tax=Paucidesulfovibrio gracilis DSM 16080 TaxID=1121449 RepID=A0A1T4Y6W8_9BACT|nr:hypothetical protein [Paucidesulfovibrio gracilis]SKA97403.1 hypothetical protein SAMN02745704_02846 [Paucidesulfovibrio gracilis DSM 16080]